MSYKVSTEVVHFIGLVIKARCRASRRQHELHKAGEGQARGRWKDRTALREISVQYHRGSKRH
ncbi:MAG: hypothetical protein ACKPKO_50525, partial [Candidatus Fonsibacter sp.]